MSINLPVIPSSFTTTPDIVSTVPMDVNQQISVSLAIRRPTFNGITLKDYADGVIAGKIQYYQGMNLLVNLRLPPKIWI